MGKEYSAAQVWLGSRGRAPHDCHMCDRFRWQRRGWGTRLLAEGALVSGTSQCLEWCTLVLPPFSCLVKTLVYLEERKIPKFHWKLIFCIFLPLCWLPNNRVVFYFTNRTKARKYKVTSLCFDPFAVWQIPYKSWPLLPSQCEFITLFKTDLTAFLWWVGITTQSVAQCRISP